MSVTIPERLPMGNSARRARAKETLWRLAALSFAHPVPEFHEALASGAFHAAFSEAWSQVTGRPWPKSPVSPDFATFEAGYISAFLHGDRGKPVAALLAGEYEVLLAGLTRPVFMLNLTAFYRHFGLKAAVSDEGRNDEPDHLSGMMEFMTVLCHLEAKALENGRDPSPPRRAQRDFLCRYLEPVLASVAEALRRKTVPALDPTLAQLIQDMASWADEQIVELEARVGPFRDPDAPRPGAAAGPPSADPAPATHNLWG